MMQSSLMWSLPVLEGQDWEALTLRNAVLVEALAERQ